MSGGVMFVDYYPEYRNQILKDKKDRKDLNQFISLIKKYNKERIKQKNKAEFEAKFTSIQRNALFVAKLNELCNLDVKNSIVEFFKEEVLSQVLMQTHHNYYIFPFFTGLLDRQNEINKDLELKNIDILKKLSNGDLKIMATFSWDSYYFVYTKPFEDNEKYQNYLKKYQNNKKIYLPVDIKPILIKTSEEELKRTGRTMKIATTRPKGVHLNYNFPEYIPHISNLNDADRNILLGFNEIYYKIESWVEDFFYRLSETKMKDKDVYLKFLSHIKYYVITPYI